MAKQIEGVLEQLLLCAKDEFLKKGYMDASLRTIATNANTSTGSIYTRFGDKEGLFRAIVEPVADEMKNIFTRVQEDFCKFDADQQEKEMENYTSEEANRMIAFMYDHLDEFKMLLDASYGTLFQNFVNELVDIEVRYTCLYMETIGIPSVSDKKMTEDFLHMITTAYMNGMFEVIRHDMDIDTAKEYIGMLLKYHHAGFHTLVNRLG